MSKVVVKLPPLTPHQQKIFYDPARVVVCEGSTKSGKTVGALAWQLDQVIRVRPGMAHLWVASVYPQAKIAFDRMCRWLTKADPGKTIWDTNKSELCITFHNGSRWFFKGSDNPDSIYGADYASAVVDECSRCKEEAWAAVRSTTTQTRGQIRLIGNVTSRLTWAYKLGQLGRQGTPGISYHLRTAYDAIADGITQPEEVEEAERVLPKDVFDALYKCIPPQDGMNPFGLSSILACIRPLSNKPPVCFGIDLAKSVDYVAVVGLDEDGATCRFERWHGTTWDTTEARIVGMVGELPALCDSSGVGDPIVERMQRSCPNLDGYQTGSKKQQLIQGLCVSIQKNQVFFPQNSAACPIQSELESYEWSVTSTGRISYSAPPGLHDDCVIALALAALHHDKYKATGKINVEWVGLLDREAQTTWDSIGTGDEWEARLA